MDCSEFIDVELDGIDILAKGLIKRTQNKAPNFGLGDGRLLRFLWVISHFDFLID